MQPLSGPRSASQVSANAPRGDGDAVRDDALRGHANADCGPCAVMIVDDHARFRSALRDWIAGLHAGYELIEAGSGEEAVVVAGRREIQAVLMDLELPGMNGLEATRRIREILPNVAVIIVSQHAAQFYIERARAAGAFAWVTKDKVFHELVPAMGRALDSVVDLRVHHG